MRRDREQIFARGLSTLAAKKTGFAANLWLTEVVETAWTINIGSKQLPLTGVAPHIT
jgi:hypothetical protein